MDHNNNKIEFITVSGYYVPEPLCFMHIWNQSNSVGEVVHILREAWKHFKANNQLIPNGKGETNEPSLKPSTYVAKAKEFRSRGSFMKDLPKGFSSKYNWSEIIAASMQYKPNKSRFKF